eukprot:3688932-Rhodomonas_salina.3
MAGSVKGALYPEKDPSLQSESYRSPRPPPRANRDSLFLCSSHPEHALWSETPRDTFHLAATFSTILRHSLRARATHLVEPALEQQRCFHERSVRRTAPAEPAHASITHDQTQSYIAPSS